MRWQRKEPCSCIEGNPCPKHAREQEIVDISPNVVPIERGHYLKAMRIAREQVK